MTRRRKSALWSRGCAPTMTRESGLCLPLDCACYMLHKCWTGAYCRYFREAVLPLDPELQAALTTEGISPELRACAVCGKAFLPEGRQAYCSDACKAEGNRRKSRERMRKMREKKAGRLLRFAASKGLTFRAFLEGVSGGGNILLHSSRSALLFRNIQHFGSCWPEAQKGGISWRQYKDM